MTRHRLYLDADMHPRLAVRLRSKGVDVVSARECGMGRASDPEQLEWATREARTLVTFNVGHFVALHTDCLWAGRTHAGISVSTQRPFGDVLRRILSLVGGVEPAMFPNRLEYLGAWPPAAAIPDDVPDPG